MKLALGESQEEAFTFPFTAKSVRAADEHRLVFGDISRWESVRGCGSAKHTQMQCWTCMGFILDTNGHQAQFLKCPFLLRQAEIEVRAAPASTIWRIHEWNISGDFLKGGESIWLMSRGTSNGDAYCGRILIGGEQTFDRHACLLMMSDADVKSFSRKWMEKTLGLQFFVIFWNMYSKTCSRGFVRNWQNACCWGSILLVHTNVPLASNI